MDSASIEPFFKTLAAANPSPGTELEYSSPFELLCAVILSAQATDRSVNRATRTLFAVADTPWKMAALGADGIDSHIQGVNLHRNKARFLSETCRLLVERHGGEVPRTRAELEALPGVGRKTASVVLNTAFGAPTLGVDTHILRVANRTGLAPGKTPLAVELKLLECVPEAYLPHAHHWLLLHGRYVCIARQPLCWKCAVARWCDYEPKTRAPTGLSVPESKSGPIAPEPRAAWSDPTSDA